MTFSQTMIRELRSLRVAVFHPDDTDRDELMLHIRRIGCTVYADWPIPPRPAPETDIALCLLCESGEALPNWPAVPLIAILEYEVQPSSAACSIPMPTALSPSRSEPSASFRPCC